MMLRTLKWTIAVGVLLALLLGMDAELVLDTLKRVDVIHLAILILAFVGVVYVLESLLTVLYLARFDLHLPFREILALRGYLYIASYIHIAISFGAFALFLINRMGITARKSGGMMALFAYTDLVAIAIPPLLLLILFPSSELSAVLYGCAVILASALVLIAVSKIQASRRYLQRLPLFDVFAELPLKGWLIILAMRLVVVFVFLVFHVLAMPLFDIHVPTHMVITLLPVAMVVSSIPITPAGLGTTQAAMVFLFRDYATPESILTFSLVVIALTNLGRLPIGLWYAWRYPRLLEKP